MSQKAELEPIVLNPNDGRVYPMGRMSAVFKADLEETKSAVSVSEWWLEPKTEGPHIHQHPESHVFYVIEGELSVFLQGRDWFQAKQGSYIFIPGDTEHGFENRSNKTVGFISINTPCIYNKARRLSTCHCTSIRLVPVFPGITT